MLRDLSITKNKSFVSDCKRYKQIIEQTKNKELEVLVKKFISKAHEVDKSFNEFNLDPLNFGQHRNNSKELQQLRLTIEQKILSLNKTQKQF